jgi:hypothetical protein
MDENPFLPGIAHLIPGNDAPEQRAGGLWSSKAGRLMQGMAEPVAGGAQLLAHATGMGTETADSAVDKLHNLYQASRKEAGLTPQDWDYWAGAGNMASPVNLLPGAAIGRIAGPATTLLGAAGRGAAAGAAAGATQPVVTKPGESYAAEKTAQIGGGAIAGGVLGPVAHGVAGAMAPNISPEMRAFIHEGGEPTTGQMFGPESWAKRLEDVGASVPVVGSWIRAARLRSNESFDKVAANRALAHINERVTPGLRTGHELSTDVADRLGAEFQQIHAATSMAEDLNLRQDLLHVGQRYRTLGPERLQQLQAYIDDAIEQPLTDHGGTLPGQVVHGNSANLRRAAGEFMADRDANNRNLGRALEDVYDAMQAALERQNPGMARQLQNANRGWAEYARFRHASASGPAQAFEGTFTPTQYGAAVRAQDRSAGKGASSRGTAMGQELAEFGRRHLPSKIADSGTPERALTMALIGGGASISPAGAIAAGVIPALYSEVGQRFARRALLNRPQGVRTMADALNRYTPVAAPQTYLAMNRGTED